MLEQTRDKPSNITFVVLLFIRKKQNKTKQNNKKNKQKKKAKNNNNNNKTDWICILIHLESYCSWGTEPLDSLPNGSF